MPFKVCPKCGTKHGVRRLLCDCGHDFACKRPERLVGPSEGQKRKRRKKDEFPYPEPGTWIWDRPKGMPPICPPSTLPAGSLSAGRIKEQVSYEGLGFCIYGFIRADKIADPKLRELWVQARSTMQEIVHYLDQTPWEDGEEEEWEDEGGEGEEDDKEDEDD